MSLLKHKQPRTHNPMNQWISYSQLNLEHSGESTWVLTLSQVTRKYLHTLSTLRQYLINHNVFQTRKWLYTNMTWNGIWDCYCTTLSAKFMPCGTNRWRVYANINISHVTIHPPKFCRRRIWDKLVVSISCRWILISLKWLLLMTHDCIAALIWLVRCAMRSLLPRQHNDSDVSSWRVVFLMCVSMLEELAWICRLINCVLNRHFSQKQHEVLVLQCMTNHLFLLITFCHNIMLTPH